MRRSVVAALVVAAVMLPAAAARAEKPTLTYTIIERADDTISLPLVDTCLGPVTVYMSHRLFVFHATEFISGPNAEAIHTTYTMNGRYLIDPDDPALPSYVGRYLNHGTNNFARTTYGSSVTFKTIAHSPDGSLLRSDVHFQFIVTPEGVTHSISFRTIVCPD